MGPSKYPKAWSEWKYDEKKKCLKSTREVSRGQFEVAYKKRSTNDAPKHTRAESSKAHSEAQVHQDYYQAQEVEYPDAGDATEVLGQNFSNMRMTDYPQEGTVANSQVQLQYGSNDLNHGTSYYSPGIDTATSQGFGSGTTYSSQNATSSSFHSQSGGQRWIHTRDKRVTHDRLDKSYKVQRSDKFVFGKVFKVLWAEPQGAAGTVITTQGGDSHQKVRRFVIMKTYPGHSLCIPVLTYGGQGTLKWGVHPDDHAIIYTSKDRGPITLPGETLIREAIRMEPIDPSHGLDNASRVNYCKIYTVEHNVKVFFIGALTRTAQVQAAADYNQVHTQVMVDPDPEVATSGSTGSGNYQLSPDYNTRTAEALHGAYNTTPRTPDPEALEQEGAAPSMSASSYPEEPSYPAQFSTQEESYTAPNTEDQGEDDLYGP